MYTLLIADDEEIERKALGLLFQKEMPEISVVGYASNGVELLTQVESLQPDIAIVDVNMPGLNGIETIDLLHGRNTKTRFIVNTAYDDFEYVQKALSLKVDAYLLKPGKNIATIDAVKKLCDSIKKSKQDMQSRNQIYEVLANIQPVLESELMYSIFAQEPAKESLQTWCEIYALHFTGGVIATLLPCDCVEGFRTFESAELRSIIHEILDGSCNSLISVNRNAIHVFIFEGEHRSSDLFEHWLKDLFNVLLSKLNQNNQLSLRCGVGGIQRQFEHMGLSYKQSLKILNIRHDSCLVFWDQNCGTANDLSNDMKKSSERPEIKNHYVLKVIDIIATKYAQDLSLQSVAEEINISPYYLTRLFKAELGCSFVKYLTHVRMERAIYLAKTTQLTVQEIGEQTGYINSTYFCRVFKRTTGNTLGEIRGGDSG